MSRQVRFNARPAVRSFSSQAAPASVGYGHAQSSVAVASQRRYGWSDFDAEAGRRGDYILILHAHWCGACKSLLSRLHGIERHPQVVVIEDSHLQQGLTAHYPYITAYREGRRVGEVSQDALVQWYRQNVQ